MTRQTLKKSASTFLQSVPNPKRPVTLDEYIRDLDNRLPAVIRSESEGHELRASLIEFMTRKTNISAV
jgi:hypothetical protein